MDYTDNPRVSFDEQGNMCVDGVNVKIKSVSFENKKAMNVAYKDLKNSFDLGAISADQFYKELESLRNYYLEQGSETWWKYTKQILSYESKLIEEQNQMMIDKQTTALATLYFLGEISAKEYYSGLEKIRDDFIAKDSKEWLSYTNSLGKLYKKELEKSNELTDKLMGGILHHYTIKDQDGNIIDKFYNLISPDSKTAEKFLEGFSYLAQNGAPEFVLNDYLSRSPDDAQEVIALFRELGDKLPAYFADIAQTRSEINAMTNSVFNTEAMKTAINEIITAIKDSGLIDGFDIIQNFYGNSFSPAEISQETTNALKLQGVDL